jgi:hypothetical protein
MLEILKLRPYNYESVLSVASLYEYAQVLQIYISQIFPTGDLTRSSTFPVSQRGQTITIPFYFRLQILDYMPLLTSRTQCAPRLPVKHSASQCRLGRIPLPSLP